MSVNVPGIFDKFKLYVKSTGASFFDADQLPILESTALDYPGLRMLIRGRDQNRLTGPANGFVSKVKWQTTGNYGPRQPLTPMQWDRAGGMEFMSSNYCHEAGTLTLGKQEVEWNAGSVMDASSMRQKFDDVLLNNRQDFYVDIAEKIEDTCWAVPTPRMEDPQGNVPRGFFAGMNEWVAGHNVYADGCFPGITRIQNYDPAVPGAKMAATVRTYDTVTKQDGTASGHLFQAFSRGFRDVNFRAVPLAENLTQGTEGQREVYASIDGALLLDRTLNAHDNVTAVEGTDNALTMRTRFTGADIVDVVGMEDFAVCPSYAANGDPDGTAAALYNAGAASQQYYTESTSPNAEGPRFYVPYQPHMRPIWSPDGFLAESGMYTLDESIPDALVMHVMTYRNMHFQSFRRGLIIRPSDTIAGI